MSSISQNVERQAVKFAINSKGVNKQWNMEVLTTGFENQEGSIHDIVRALKQGYAFIGGQLKNGERRSKAAMTGCQFITVEIDNATLLRDSDGMVVKDENGKGKKVYFHQMTIEEALADPFIKENCAIAYTSPSHTANWHRFRLIFKLPRFVEGGTAEALTKQLMRVLPHDPACKDCSRVFYGNTNADFFIINDKAEISNQWMLKAISDCQREKADRERKRKARELWLKEHADEMEEMKALVLEALPFIPPRTPGAGNYPDCMRVLMVLKDLFGDSEAEMLAEGWSPSIPGTTWDIRRKIKSFKHAGGVSPGTLFMIAQQHGFRFPKKEVDKTINKNTVGNSVSTPIETKEPSKQDKAKSAAQDKADRLRLDIHRYLKESDPLTRLMVRNEICTTYQISKFDLHTHAERLDEETNVKKKTKYTGEEFFDEEVKAIRYVIPRYAPVGESILLCSEAGVGKSSFTTDAIYSVLTGEDFLGEKLDRKGKVLLITSDESKETVQRRMRDRGITRRDLRGSFEAWDEFDILRLQELEEYLEDNRPDLVVVDSITTMCINVGIQERDPEFARYLYKLKNMFQRYGASSIILHHANKDPFARGLSKVSGSARIPAAFWGVFLIDRVDANNTDHPDRWLKMLKGREVETFTIKMTLNPKHTWLENGIYSVVDEDGKIKETKRWVDRVVEVLKRAGAALEYEEIQAQIGTAGSYLYKVLDKLESERKVTKRRSTTNKRRWVWEYPTEVTEGTPPLDGHTMSNEEFDSEDNLDLEKEYSQMESEEKTDSLQVIQEPELIRHKSTDVEGGSLNDFPEPTKDAIPANYKPFRYIKTPTSTVANVHGIFKLGSRVQVDGLPYQSGGYSIEKMGDGLAQLFGQKELVEIVDLRPHQQIPQI